MTRSRSSGVEETRLVYVYDVSLPSQMASSVNVVKTCAALAAEGHHVTLVHFRGQGTLSDYYGARAQFRSIALPVNRNRRGALRLLAWVAAITARLTGAIVYSRKAAFLRPAAQLGCPVALEMHGPIEPGTTKNAAAISYLLENGRMRSVICISQALARKVAEDWPAADGLLAVAHDGADAMPLCNPDARSRSGRPLLGYAGHLYPGKGMEIVSELARARPEWDFLIVGGRPQDIRAWRAKTPDNVEFAGMIPHADVRSRLAQCDILLAPYGRTVIVSDGRTDVAQWMSPLKLFEYMAIAKPMVISDLPVIREVVRDGDNARLAAPDNAKDWERVISELLADPDAAAQMGRRAHEDLERTYSWQARARAILKAIER